jgi:hypothetical protein
MRGFRLLAGACLCLTAGFIAIPVTPASAGFEDGTCDAGEWCLFRDANFQGCTFDGDADLGGGTSGNLDRDYVNCKQKMQDSISSYRNGTPAWMLLWEHPNQKGFLYCVAPRGSGSIIKSFNDKASSIAMSYPENFAQFGGEGKCNFVDRD